MKRINLNEMAKTITLKESGKKEISIGQVKEVLKLTLQELGKFEDSQIIKVIDRYRK